MDLPDTIKNRRAFLSSPAAGFDGLFDWSWTKGCFGDKNITPMDFDGVVERGGNFLVFETKGFGVPVPQGQIYALDAAHRIGCFTIMFIEGKLKPERAKVWYQRGFMGGGKMKEHLPVTDIEKLKGIVSAWYQFANKNWTNPEKAYDDIEYFNERAAILEYEAGYTRKEAENEARRMMASRSKQTT